MNVAKGCVKQQDSVNGVRGRLFTIGHVESLGVKINLVPRLTHPAGRARAYRSSRSARFTFGRVYLMISTIGLSRFAMIG